MPPYFYGRDHRGQREHPLVIFRLRAMVTPGLNPWDRTCLVHQGPSVFREVRCRPPQIITDGSAPSIFDPNLEYSTEQVLLFWQLPSWFSQWSPSSFVVDDVSYPCAEYFMMAEKGRFFQDYLAYKLIMSSPDPSAHERIGRGVRNSDNAGLGLRLRRRRPCWQLCQVLRDPDHEPSPPEQWHKTLG